LQDAYEEWYYDRSRTMSEEEVRSLVGHMEPVEEYLKELYEGGIRAFMWSGDNTETYRFRNLDAGENIICHPHYRYDYHIAHSHEYFQLCYILSGSAQITLSDKDVPFTKGDVILISPATMHRLQVYSDDCLVLKFYIRVSTFDRTFYKWLGENNRMSDLMRRTVYDKKKNAYMIFHAGGDPAIEGDFVSLTAELMSWRSYRSIIAESRLTEIFCKLAREYLDDADISGDEGSSELGAIMQYIVENRETVTLEDAAAQAGYSKNYLCRLLRKRTGRSFLEIVNTARVDEAEKLLLSTDLTMEEISSCAGFTSTKQFYRVFRQHFEMSPGEYRRERKE